VDPRWPARLPAVYAWLGEPIEIKPPTAARLERYARSNLLIVGGDEPQAFGPLAATILSLAAQRSPQDARFVIADLTRPESPFFGLFSRSSLPHATEIAGPRQARALLNELLLTLEQRLHGEIVGPDIFFIIAGIQRWRELRGAEQFIQSEMSKGLARLAEEGPELGIHLIAWVDGFTALERVFKRSGVGNFDLRMVFHISEQDSNALLDTNAAAKLIENRAFFRFEDWEMGRLEKFKPYPVPEEEVLTKLIEQIRAKVEPEVRP
jgi:hypothetical protein